MENLRRNLSQERPRTKRCLRNPIPAVATTGLEDFWKGASKPMSPSEQESCSAGPGCVYIFNCRMAKKLIHIKRTVPTEAGGFMLAGGRERKMEILAKGTFALGGPVYRDDKLSSTSIGKTPFRN